MEIRLQANSNFNKRLLRESQRLPAPPKNENDSKPRAAVNPVDYFLKDKGPAFCFDWVTYSNQFLRKNEDD